MVSFAVGYNIANGLVVYSYYVITAIITFAYLINIILRKKINKVEKIQLSRAIWMIPAFLFTPVAYDISLHMVDIFVSITTLITAIYVVHNILNNQNPRVNQRIFFIIILYWIAVNIGAMIINAGDNQDGVSYSTAGIYENRNTLAVTGLFFLVNWLFVTSKNIKLFAIISKSITFSLSLIIISTLSTKGIIGLCIISISYVLLHLKFNVKQVAGGILTLALLAGLASYFSDIVLLSIARLVGRFYLDFGGVLDEKTSSLALASQSIRVELKEAANAMIMENPVFGIGLRASEFILETASGVVTYAHSNYYELALAVGLIALPIYYAPIVYLFLKSSYKFARNRRSFNFYTPLTLGLVLLLDSSMVSYKNFAVIFFTTHAIYIYFHEIKNIQAKKSSLGKPVDTMNLSALR